MQTEPKPPHENLKYEYWRWQIFAISSLTYAGLYMTRRAFSVAKIGMGESSEIGLTKVQMSQLDMAYLIVYAIGQFVWGICGDRFGTRKVLIIGMLASFVLAFTFGVSSSFFIFSGSTRKKLVD
ncbi:MAG: MFS transporter [Gammaproteobacteria bacterium]|nr:MFS transporter [Gammaproteobacteria bacterium]